MDAAEIANRIALLYNRQPDMSGKQINRLHGSQRRFVEELAREIAVDNKRLVAFAREMIDHAFNGEDVDGATIQDTAVRLGLLREEAFDPRKHGGTTMAEIGDTWFVYTDVLSVSAPALPHPVEG